MARREQTLYRDDNDKMIGGVCQGLGRYFDIDTTLVRVAFVVLTMLGGGGLLGYLILWIVLDPAPAGYWTDSVAEVPSEPVIEHLEVVDIAEGFDLTDAQNDEEARR